MGVCQSKKQQSTKKPKDITASSQVGKVLEMILVIQVTSPENNQIVVHHEKSQSRIKSESQVMDRRASRKSDIEVRTPSSQKKSPLTLCKQKFDLFDIQKGFFKKYSTINFNDTEQTLICQHNLTFQLVKVTILDPRLDKCKQFWKQLKLHNMVEFINKQKNNHICQYTESFQEKDQVYLVQEHCKGGTLSSLIEKEPLPYEKAVHLIIQILDAVNHFHSLNLSHGSLTIDSFSISETKSLLIKLEDTNPIFYPESSDDVIDLEKQFPIERYRAPEDEKTMANDIWAVGIILHQLLTGEFPQMPKKEGEVLDWKPLKKLKNIPSDGLHGIKLMLEYHPTKRLCLKQIIEKKYFKVDINKETLEQSILNLSLAKQMSQFQLAIIYFMMNSFQKEEVQILGKLFEDGDKDHDGFLNKKDLENLFKILIPDNQTLIDDQIEKIFQKLDVDNSGTISLDEFVTAACNKKELLSDENLEGCFRILANSNGVITAKSMARKIQINEQEIKQDIQQYVHDQISLQPFKEIMNRLI